jgi:integrase
MPVKTSANGSYRFDRVFPGVGRLQRSSGAKTLRQFHRRDALLSKLYEQGRLDLLRGLKSGAITIAELLDADRRDRLAATRADSVLLRRPLWAEAQRRFAGDHATERRYRTSLDAFRARGVLGDTATVAMLADVDWDDLMETWDRSAADWNHLRRAVSRLLSLMLGRAHPWRAEVLAAIPTRVELPRDVDLTPEAFHAALGELAEHYHPYIWALVGSGMRRGELWRLRKSDLMPLTHAVKIRGAKAGSDRTLDLDPWIWRQVERVVPAALTEDRVYRAWRHACEQAGLGRVRLHDLRHCFGQWSLDGGMDERDVQKAMGHRTAHMTRRYTTRKQRRQVSMAVARVLGVPQPDPQPSPESGARRGA